MNLDTRLEEEREKSDTLYASKQVEIFVGYIKSIGLWMLKGFGLAIIGALVALFFRFPK